MPKSKPPDWEAIRRRYVETDAKVADIARDAGISAPELDRVRKREGWLREKPRGLPPGRKRAAASPPSGSEAVATPALANGHDPIVPAAPDAADDHEADPAPTSLTSKRTPKRATSTATPAGRRRLLERLVALISLKLQQLERRMESDLDRADADDPQSATDHERETRAIGALIDNLGKVTDMETGLAKSTNGKSAAAADLAGEADRYRRELAERLRKIVDSASARS